MRSEAAEVVRQLPGIDPKATLYVADRDLRVIYSNEEWRRFAEENDGDAVVAEPSRATVLDGMHGATRERWEAVYRLLVDRELPHYEEDFICSSPQERRIFRLRITPVESPGADGPWLVHHSVRIDDSAEEREDMRKRLRALETDAGLLEREYRERVLGHDVQVPGFRVARYFQPLDDVGGDLVWSRRYASGRTDLVVADAMGHGTEAAVHAAKLALMLDQLADDHRAPQDVLAGLNRGLIRHRPEHESAFATGLYLRFEAGTSCLRCANFGHLAPFFSRTGPVKLKVGLAIGMVDSIPVWPETDLDLVEHGTRFLVFSDGVTEQFDESGAMYGADRLLESFRRTLDVEVETALEQIVGDVHGFRGDAIVKDDLTLVLFELDTAGAQERP